MHNDLAQEAISAALSGDWHQAVKLNSNILEVDHENVDALNRLARAYAELGEIQKAKIFSSKVLKIDPTNTIATKCQQKWNNLKNGEHLNGSALRADVFLEEPGKTKIVTLLNLGSDEEVSKLVCGDVVSLTAHAHKFSVQTKDNKYVGRFPDDLAARLIRLMKEGYCYECFIKSVEDTKVRVFIRETIKPIDNQSPSFPSDKLSKTSDETVSEV
jgi:tetratricopeptide (TPR) repeat protein